MILQKLVMENFRQFYGRQEITFAPPGDRNVTLIHAENSVGKTTILNAVMWTFFEHTTTKFEMPDKIVNFESMAEDRRTAVVEVYFEHDSNTFIARRKFEVTNSGGTSTKFEVIKINANKSLSAPLDNPRTFINTVIPDAMAPYFFFDGEQAETFSSGTNYKAVGKAIRAILGCDLIEAGIDDLKASARQFGKRLGELPQQDIAMFERRIAMLNDSIDERTKKIASLDDTVATLNSQLAEVRRKLRDATETKQLEIQRETLERELDSLRQQTSEAIAEKLRWIGSKSLPIVAPKLTQQTLDFVDEARIRGKIPSPYNEEFVRGLLSAHQCVCDRPLSEGTSEWRAVQMLLQSAASAEVMNRFVRARGRLTSLKEGREDAPALLENIEQKLVRTAEGIRRVEQQLSEVSTKIKGLPVAEIQEREAARTKLEADVARANSEKMRLQIENEQAANEKRNCEADVARLAASNTHAQKLALRRTFAEQASELLEQLMRKYEGDARDTMREKVNQILETAARKHYRLDISDGFELNLLFANGTPTPKSSGENQLMSLAFIAALVSFAESRSRQKVSDLFIPATIAPLMLDSPFGQLDKTYRSSTASFIPSLAPQVILLLSSSQGDETVTNVLQPRIGREYVLIAENSGPRGGKGEDVVTIRGRALATTRFGTSKTRTVIEVVDQ